MNTDAVTGRSNERRTTAWIVARMPRPLMTTWGVEAVQPPMLESGSQTPPGAAKESPVVLGGVAMRFFKSGLKREQQDAVRRPDSRSSLEEWHQQTTIPFINGVWDSIRTQLAPNGHDRHLTVWRFGSIAVAVEVSAWIDAIAGSKPKESLPTWRSLSPEFTRHAMDAALAVFFSRIVWSKPVPALDDEQAMREAQIIFAEDPWNVGLVHVQRAQFQSVQATGGFVLPGEDFWFIREALFGRRHSLDDLLLCIAEGDWPPGVLRAQMMGVSFADFSDQKLIAQSIDWSERVVKRFNEAGTAMHSNALTVNQFLDPILGI
ncbi:MAG: hypothetical protein IT300_12605 [Dehalococcoidia bacterium]|jgi:hypothetical protein|nr:hypothetical protein [Dehalococcoidia bacterium]